jgi:endonuclease/exonuclease/phosphatase family metal-dependent hydrolase
MGRPLLVTEIAIDDLTLTVATCHLDSLVENHQTRIRQLQQAFRQLDSASNALLLGDFNFGDDDSEQSALNSSYKDVWRQLKPHDPGYTYNGVTNPLAYDRVPPMRLDRILIRSDKLEPVAVMLIGQEPVEHKGNSLYLSDHFGVIAHLRRTVH